MLFAINEPRAIILSSTGGSLHNVTRQQGSLEPATFWSLGERYGHSNKRCSKNIIKSCHSSKFCRHRESAVLYLATRIFQLQTSYIFFLMVPLPRDGKYFSATGPTTITFWGHPPTILLIIFADHNFPCPFRSDISWYIERVKPLVWNVNIIKFYKPYWHVCIPWQRILLRILKN